MTPGEVGDLLRWCSSVDQFLKQTSPEEGAVMMAGWHQLLTAVPAEVAGRAARDHYAQGEARTITPGDILDAWAVVRRREVREETAAIQARSIQQALEDSGVGSLFGSSAQYLTDMVAAVARGEDPSTVTRPAGVRVLNLSPEANARERACAFPTICVCTHEECRDGWLDVETTRVNALGKSYAAAQRCPMCNDGILMAQERGVARRPRRVRA